MNMRRLWLIVSSKEIRAEAIESLKIDIGISVRGKRGWVIIAVLSVLFATLLLSISGSLSGQSVKEENSVDLQHENIARLEGRLKLNKSGIESVMSDWHQAPYIFYDMDFNRLSEWAGRTLASQRYGRLSSSDVPKLTRLISLLEERKQLLEQLAGQQ